MGHPHGPIPPIEVSGNYDSILVTQGLRDYTLVAGKRCLFRIWLDSADQVGSVTAVHFTIDNGPTRVVPSAFLERLLAPRSGPSVGLIVKGCNFPTAGTYSVSISVLAGNNTIVSIPFQLKFKPTRDLRVLVLPAFDTQNNRFPALADVKAVVDPAMKHFGSLLPVRDGVLEYPDFLDQTIPLTSRTEGVRYHYGTPVNNYQGGDFQFTTEYDTERKAINQAAAMSQVPVDSVDLVLVFMLLPQNVAEPLHPGETPPGSVISWVTGHPITGEITICHELGHGLGLEDHQSPYNDVNDILENDGIDHALAYRADKTTDNTGAPVDHADPYAYNFLANGGLGAPFNNDLNACAKCDKQGDLNACEKGCIADVMHWCCQVSPDLMMYNYFDWEYIRSTFLVNLKSSGTDVNPFSCAPSKKIVLPPPFPPPPRPLPPPFGEIAHLNLLEEFGPEISTLSSRRLPVIQNSLSLLTPSAAPPHSSSQRPIGSLGTITFAVRAGGVSSAGSLSASTLASSEATRIEGNPAASAVPIGLLSQRFRRIPFRACSRCRRKRRG